MTKLPEDISSRFDFLIEMSMVNVRNTSKSLAGSNFRSVEPELKDLLSFHFQSGIEADLYLIDKLQELKTQPQKMQRS